MNPFVLVYFGELVLKKGNRDFFERILKLNIGYAFSGILYRFEPSYGRFCLRLGDKVSLDEVRKRLLCIFGISYFCFAFKTDQNFEEFAEIALNELQREIRRREEKQEVFSTFCVRVNRSNKNYPKTSVEIERELGAYLLSHGIDAKVRLKDPDIIVHVDLVNKDAFVYFDKIRGAGGLPTSSTGRVVSLLSSGIDSPVASFRMMKRGCRVIFLHFHSYPYTDSASQDHVREIVRILNQYQSNSNSGSKIYFVPFGEFQKKIVALSPAKLRVILYRRAMMQIAERIARREKAGCLVTGESLGQVASQTLENIGVTNSGISLPIFRPLIGFDKEEIIVEARRLGTYDISIQPYGDCCSVFVPEHPEIRAQLKTVQSVEEKIGMQQLIEEVFLGIQMEKI